jgi:predicted metal-binding protein
MASLSDRVMRDNETSVLLLNTMMSLLKELSMILVCQTCHDSTEQFSKELDSIQGATLYVKLLRDRVNEKLMKQELEKGARMVKKSERTSMNERVYTKYSTYALEGYETTKSTCTISIDRIKLRT